MNGSDGGQCSQDGHNNKESCNDGPVVGYMAIGGVLVFLFHDGGFKNGKRMFTRKEPVVCSVHQLSGFS